MPIFSFIRYTLTELFTNLTINNKLINKWVRLFTHQSMCQEEKIISTSSQGCKIVLFLKKCISSHRRCRSSHQRHSIRKGVLKNFANFTGKYLHWSLFYEVASLQPASLLKRDSNTSAFGWSLRNFLIIYFAKYLQTTASEGVL